VHFRASDWCLATAESLSASKGLRAKVFVVDNSNSKELRTRLSPRVTLLSTEKNLGYTGGANRVLREWLDGGSGQYVVVACHDVIVPPTALAAMISVLENDRRVGVVGPGGMHAGEPADALAVGLRLSPRRWLSGTCLIFRRECLQEIGLFDETFGSYVEDMDICFRAWDHGWAVVACDEIIVRTHGSSSSLKDRLIAKNMVVLAAKRRGFAGAVAEMLLQGVVVGLYLASYVVHGRDSRRRKQSAARARLRIVGTMEGILRALGGGGQPSR
jgi:GT2 family glycosyltransferase